MNLEDLKGQYSGKIFLVGNGPSMNKLTVKQTHKLRDEYCFSGSRWFMWDKHWTTDFYILTERKQATEWKERGFGKAKAKIAKFWTTWQPAPPGWVPIPKPPSNAHDVLNYGMGGLKGNCHVGQDGSPHLHHGKDTPLAMAQVASYLGFSEMYLVGCETEGTDRSYPDSPRATHTSGIMDDYYRRAGKESSIVDCTINGRLGREGILKYIPLDKALGIK